VRWNRARIGLAFRAIVCGGPLVEAVDRARECVRLGLIQTRAHSRIVEEHSRDSVAHRADARARHHQ
jgi:hypothetical protein